LKERDEKEPGFARREQHKKNMILNPSATPPFKVGVETSFGYFWIPHHQELAFFIFQNQNHSTPSN